MAGFVLSQGKNRVIILPLTGSGAVSGLQRTRETADRMLQLVNTTDTEGQTSIKRSHSPQTPHPRTNHARPCSPTRNQFPISHSTRSSLTATMSHFPSPSTSARFHRVADLADVRVDDLRLELGERVLGTSGTLQSAHENRCHDASSHLPFGPVGHHRCRLQSVSADQRSFTRSHCWDHLRNRESLMVGSDSDWRFGENGRGLTRAPLVGRGFSSKMKFHR